VALMRTISTRSLCTKRRGTAEVETLFAVVVLLTILMFVLCSVKIALSRMGMQNQAGEQAFHDGTEAANPQFANNPAVAPVDESAFMNTGVATLPDLPNRMHVPSLTETVPVFDGTSNQLPPATTHGTAALAAPAWVFSAYPVGGGDEDATAAWFNAYVLQSHEEFVQPLGLAAPWTP